MFKISLFSLAIYPIVVQIFESEPKGWTYRSMDVVWLNKEYDNMIRVQAQSIGQLTVLVVEMSAYLSLMTFLLT